jgi:hypothetical protein
MTAALENVARHLREARSNALQAAEVAAERAGSRPAIGDLIEIEAQLTDAERAERRLALLEHRLAEGT